MAMTVRLVPLSLTILAFLAAATVLFLRSESPAAALVASWSTRMFGQLQGPRQHESGGSRSQHLSTIAQNTDFTAEELQDWDQILSKAKMDDGHNTVILTTLNQAWAANGTMLDLFLESLREGEDTSRLLQHLVVIGLDQSSYARCTQIHDHCFALRTEGVDFSGEEKTFMTEDYLKMMWRRIFFLGVTLRMGYSFVFSDADVMWFRDPFQHFRCDLDFEIACDLFHGQERSLDNGPNGGFVHVISNKRSMEMYKFWYESRLRYPEKHDQDVLNQIKHAAVERFGVRIRFLDTKVFGGFCQIDRSDLEVVSTLHANCCVGLEAKLRDLRRAVQDFKRYSSAASEEEKQASRKWSVPRSCIGID